jgi:RHH-type rel operon transcriptional repressor/antitoxin RelB
MLSVRIPKTIEERLDRLASRTERSRSYHVNKALEKYLEDEEDVIDAVEAYEEHLRSGHPGYTLEEMKKRYNIE